MNDQLKQHLKAVGTRFVKGLLAVVGGFALQFLLQSLPGLQSALPGVVHSPLLLTLLSAGLLALEKALQGVNPPEVPPAV